jgi:hypothetical protein
MEQRSISYYELYELEKEFDKQTKWMRFTDEEEREQSLFDFIQQWIDGNDNPTVHITPKRITFLEILRNRIIGFFKIVENAI